ncbi:MAG TPA: uridine phosphorylase [Thermodesulfobacteriota bacterium]|nr:uridine phosphorylase [Thermodesulfobacteriota bacterium]
MPYVYHLCLDESKIEGAKLALLPGDPFRSKDIAEEFDKNSEQIAWKREYCTWLGEIKGKKVLVTSTGIGGPSTSIAIDELAQLGVHTFIRVGTTGAIQSNINVGDVIITSGSIRLDGASTHYAPIGYPAVAHHEALFALIEASEALKIELKNEYHVGITASSDTFYPGQERYDSFSEYVLRRFQGTMKEWQRLHVLNYEMESSTVPALCAALGLKGGCVTGVVVNRTKEEKITKEDLELGERNAIKVAVKAMEILVSRS